MASEKEVSDAQLPTMLWEDDIQQSYPEEPLSSKLKKPKRKHSQASRRAARVSSGRAKRSPRVQVEDAEYKRQVCDDRQRERSSEVGKITSSLAAFQLLLPTTMVVENSQGDSDAEDAKESKQVEGSGVCHENAAGESRGEAVVESDCNAHSAAKLSVVEAGTPEKVVEVRLPEMLLMMNEDEVSFQYEEDVDSSLPNGVSGLRSSTPSSPTPGSNLENLALHNREARVNDELEAVQEKASEEEEESVPVACKDDGEDGLDDSVVKAEVESVEDKFSKLEIVNDSWVKCLVGTGAFGKVWKADIPGHGCCALKEFREREKFNWSEFSIPFKNRHPLIVEMLQLYKYWDSNGELAPCLAMEFVDGCTLQDLRKQRSVTEMEVKTYVTQLLVAIEHLDSCNVVFCDLKLENIMVKTGSEEIRLVDFGLAKRLEPGELCYSPGGTPGFIPMEVIFANKDKCIGFNTKADVFGVAAVAYCLFEGKLPWYDEGELLQPDQLVFKVLQQPGKLEESINKSFSEDLARVLSSMARVDFKRRPSAGHALENLQQITLSKSAMEEIDAFEQEIFSVPMETDDAAAIPDFAMLMPACDD